MNRSPVSTRVLMTALVVLLVLPVLTASGALAQSSEPQITSMQEGDASTQMEARRLKFLFWAYAVIWILMSAYLFSIGIRLRAVRQELARMRERLGSGSRP